MAPEKEINWSSEVGTPDKTGRYEIKSASGRVEEKITPGPEGHVKFSEQLRLVSENDWKEVCEDARQITEETITGFKKSLSAQQLNKKYDEVYKSFLESLARDRLMDIESQRPRYH